MPEPDATVLQAIIPGELRQVAPPRQHVLDPTGSPRNAVDDPAAPSVIRREARYRPDPSLIQGNVSDRLLAMIANRKVAGLMGQSKMVMELTGRIRRLVHAYGRVPEGVVIPPVDVDVQMTAYPARHPSTTVTKDRQDFIRDDQSTSRPTTGVVADHSGMTLASEETSGDAANAALRRKHHNVDAARKVRKGATVAAKELAKPRATYDLNWSKHVTANGVAAALKTLRPFGYGLTRKKVDADSIEYVLSSKGGEDQWRFVCVPNGDWCFDLYHNDEHVDAAFVMQPTKRGTDESGVPPSMQADDFAGDITPHEAQLYSRGWAAAQSTLKTWTDTLRKPVVGAVARVDAA